MQSPEEKERNAKVVYILGRVIFVVFMLMALDGLHEALKVTYGLHRRFDLLFPWLALGGAGSVIWKNTSRKRIDRELAGGLLIMIGFATNWSYEAMGRLASTHF
jgi:hypothetical protein